MSWQVDVRRRKRRCRQSNNDVVANQAILIVLAQNLHRAEKRLVIFASRPYHYGHGGDSLCRCIDLRFFVFAAAPRSNSSSSATTLLRSSRAAAFRLALLKSHRYVELARPFTLSCAA